MLEKTMFGSKLNLGIRWYKNTTCLCEVWGPGESDRLLVQKYSGRAPDRETKAAFSSVGTGKTLVVFFFNPEGV